MPPEKRSCCRWTVTMLHVLMCLVGGSCILIVLILREGNSTCMPVLEKKEELEGHILELVCQAMLYSCGVIGGWSLLSLFVHCCWEAKACFAMQALIYTVVGIFGLIGSSSLSTQFLLWCNDLRLIFPNASDCQEALNYYEKSFPVNNLDLSIYYRTDIILQGCSWTLAVISALLASIYISLMCVSVPNNSYDHARIVYVRDSESQPLLQVNEHNL